ncbi:hypothetical protein EPUS_00160 [Endocarpon pusillum Z07020]|uniref:CENP-V/GFA domain-containing protein n=1 Tax=Endocarpon pusillum (strain Z07020 / HMAS-L-300199) TaxID=1263415 RepID=U1GCQ4_ENDPU|nr:uncharacterized protein EPUS_00160 [Endocarpon pusillum Z07020]ERF75367.1 hypothetical protein EPUS_00160 [Endocarpon pusillum Z07020]
MNVQRHLRGSCSCGRNNYIIAVPENAATSAHVFFDSSSENRRIQATPVTVWLHIPLTWYKSNTTSFFPDETHSMIRKMFTPAHEPHSQRIFCGYCGTHLSYWTEAARDEADYLNVTVGSLFGEDLRTLEELGLLPDDVDDYDITTGPTDTRIAERANNQQLAGRDETVQRRISRGVGRDISWIEEMIDGSRLGRLQKTKRGVGRSADGMTMVEWEITEMIDNGSEHELGAGRGKRKLGEVALGGDAQMQL